MSIESFGIHPRTQIMVIGLSIAIFLFVLNLVRRKRMREQYSLLWLVLTGVLLLSAIFIDGVEAVSKAVGIYYPPAFLFLIAILMLLMLQFHFSIVISNLREQNKTLTQDVGILTEQVRALRDLADRSS